MSRIYKNNVLHRHQASGYERRENLQKEVLKDSTPFPNLLKYEDIDREFKKWVDEELSISIDGERLKTIVLYSNQRFSEYMQSWQQNDDKRNLLLNFKTISRENNPKTGTINGNTKNIPGDRDYVMKKVLSVDDAGRQFFTLYKMKQPYAIDLKYTISIVTNRYELLNDFNCIVNNKFKAIECYIRPNGHYIPMKLDDVSDDSEYSVDDRQYYSQSYSITVMAYIIDENSFSVEESPMLKFKGVAYDLRNESETYADVEEFDVDSNNRLPMDITISIGVDSNKYSFTNDTNIKITGITADNASSYKLSTNDDETGYYVISGISYDTVEYDNIGRFNPDESKFHIFKIKENEKVKIHKINRKYDEQTTKLVIHGYKIIKETDI